MIKKQKVKKTIRTIRTSQFKNTPIGFTSNLVKARTMV